MIIFTNMCTLCRINFWVGGRVTLQSGNSLLSAVKYEFSPVLSYFVIFRTTLSTTFLAETTEML